jgi:hypothetical protein
VSAALAAMLLATHPAPLTEAEMRQIGVGILAVGLVGCADSFEDPFERADYTLEVLAPGCGTVSSVPEMLPPRRFDAIEEIATFAIEWEGSACASSPLAFEEADGFDLVTDLDCEGVPRPMLLEWSGENRWDVHIEPLSPCGEVWIVAEKVDSD